MKKAKIKYGRYYSIEPYDAETYCGEFRVFTGDVSTKADDCPPTAIDDEIDSILRKTFGQNLSVGEMESGHSIHNNAGTLRRWKTIQTKFRRLMGLNGWTETKDFPS